MAKKKNNLTLEEKLKNALVPQEEQPYKIPENWVWTYLLEGFAECKDKYRKPVNAKERESREGVVPYYGATGQVGWIDDYLTNEHLVLVGEDGAPFFELLKDKAYIIEGKAWINNHVHIVKSFYGMKGNEYLKHYLNIFNYNGYVNGTTRLKLTQSRLREIPIPMAPILEQQRIVERIESLFSKLDEAKEKIQMSLDSFENRKSAILFKAFSGELTKKWREENGVKFDDWEESTIENYATTKYGYTESANFQEIGPKYLRITDIKNGKVDWNMVPYCDISEENYRKYKLEKFDIVVARTGATTGKSYLILEDVKAVYASYLIKIEIDKVELLTPQFLYLFLQTQSYWNQIIDLSSGIAQPGVNANKLKTINITVPPLEEQKEIVRILDNLFEKEQGTQELIDLIENIDLMKKSILARAFRGELGTNIPEEESAIELLKSVLEV